MCELFGEHASIVTYDLQRDSEYPAQALASCDFGIICVNTPTAHDGSCNISNVVEAVAKLPVKDILLKSTVPPGTTDMLVERTGKNVCHSPEYVGETDYYNPFWRDGIKGIPFVIFGGEPPARRYFIDILMPILGPSKTYFQCTAREAEVIKYMENAFLAMKVSFVTEFYHMCRALGIDWHTVREGWLLDPRINASHTAVFPQSPGFSGKCLPKDLRAIIQASTEAGYAPELLSEVLNSNTRFRSSVAKDYDSAQA
jgi:nucleotide sugar dehydrogenase